jgi:16S rRNA processing protein RimM
VTTTDVVVGRIGRPHGVHGEVSVEPRTDEPRRRFTDGAVLRTQSPGNGSALGSRPAALTVEGSRWHQDRLLVRFADVSDRSAAEALRGLLLVADVDAEESPEDPEEFYDHQLVGLSVTTTDGVAVGSVTAVLHSGAQDLLVVETERGEALVPFVGALVPVVDVGAGLVQVADRPGLLTPLDEPEG